MATEAEDFPFLSASFPTVGYLAWATIWGMLVLGLFGRLAALMLAGMMAVAWGVVHQMKLSGEGSGELAFIYLAGFLTILIAGTGKYSVAPQG